MDDYLPRIKFNYVNPSRCSDGTVTLNAQLIVGISPNANEKMLMYSIWSDRQQFVNNKIVRQGNWVDGFVWMLSEENLPASTRLYISFTIADNLGHTSTVDTQVFSKARQVQIGDISWDSSRTVFEIPVSYDGATDDGNVTVILASDYVTPDQFWWGNWGDIEQYGQYNLDRWSGMSQNISNKRDGRITYFDPGTPIYVTVLMNLWTMEGEEWVTEAVAYKAFEMAKPLLGYINPGCSSPDREIVDVFERKSDGTVTERGKRGQRVVAIEPCAENVEWAAVYYTNDAGQRQVYFCKNEEEFNLLSNPYGNRNCRWNDETQTEDCYPVTIEFPGLTIPVAKVYQVTVGNRPEELPERFLYFYDNLKIVNYTPGSRVRRIGNSAFSSCHSIQYVAWPDSLETIGDSVLAYISNSDFIMDDFPASLRTIGYYFCNSCTSLTHMPKLNEGLEYIYDNFFSYSAVNAPITFPDSLRSIGYGFLAGCRQFNSPLDMGNGVQSIGNNFMQNCEAFDQPFTVPESVNYIGSDFMYECMNFHSTITVNCSVTPTYSGDYDMSLATYNGDALVYTEGVRVEGPGAEAWKQKLKNMDFYPYRNIIGGYPMPAYIYYTTSTADGPIPLEQYEPVSDQWMASQYIYETRDFPSGTTRIIFTERCQNITYNYGTSMSNWSVNRPMSSTIRFANGFQYFTRITGSVAGLFQNCANFEGVDPDAPLEAGDTFIFPVNSTGIGSNCFYNCAKFNSKIQFSPKLSGSSSIGAYFLYGCTSFSHPLTIPANVSIGQSCCQGCDNFVGPLTFAGPDARTKNIGNYSFCVRNEESLAYKQGIEVIIESEGANRRKTLDCLFGWFDGIPNMAYSGYYRKITNIPEDEAYARFEYNGGNVFYIFNGSSLQTLLNNSRNSTTDGMQTSDWKRIANGLKKVNIYPSAEEATEVVSLNQSYASYSGDSTVFSRNQTLEEFTGLEHLIHVKKLCNVFCGMSKLNCPITIPDQWVKSDVVWASYGSSFIPTTSPSSSWFATGVLLCNLLEFNSPITFPEKSEIVLTDIISGCPMLNAPVSLPSSKFDRNVMYSLPVYNQPITIPDDCILSGQYFLYQLDSFNQPIVIGNNVSMLADRQLARWEVFNQPIVIGDNVTMSGGAEQLARLGSFNSPLQIGENFTHNYRAFPGDISGEVWPEFNQDIVIPASAKFTYSDSIGLFSGTCPKMASRVTFMGGVDSFPNLGDAEFTQSSFAAAGYGSQSPIYTEGVTVSAPTQEKLDALKSHFYYQRRVDAYPWVNITFEVYDPTA